MALSLPHANVGRTERVVTAAAGVGLLALAARYPRARRPLAGLSTAVLLRSLTGLCPGYATADRLHDRRQARDSRRALAGSKGVHVDQTIRIGRPPVEVYAFWRDLTRLSEHLPPAISIREINPFESEWTLLKAGVPVARWQASIINDEPGRLLAWKTDAASDVVSAGSVHFTAADRGQATDVHVRFQYAPPLGRVGAAIANLTGEGADATVARALGRVKALLEARI